MKQSIKKYLSGSLKNRVGNKLPILRLFIILFLANVAYAQDIAKTENYLPNGKYRLFGSGRGEVHNIDNQIRLHGQLSQQAGNLHIQTSLYQGNLSYEQHFHNHGHRVHSPFSNTAQKNFSAKKGSVVQGGATLTDLSVTGYEIHPADAYDGEQGGGYPAPTGARDEYLYEVNGKEMSVKVVSLDKLPSKANDNQLLRQAGIDPERYNQPQTQDNHTQIERISFANAANGNAYGDFVDLTHNGQGWESVANPMPMTSWSLPAPERGAAYYSHPSITFVRIVPQTRATLGKPTPYDHDPNAPMVSHVSAPTPKYNPYDYPTSLPLFDSALNKGKGSSGSGSQSNGNNNSQNDNDEPLIFDYLDDDYGDDDSNDSYDNYDNYDNYGNYDYNYDYNNNQQNVTEHKNTFEEDLWEVILSPPPPFTEYDDGTKNNTNTANNYPQDNSADWQAEKWDSPLDLNAAELAAELGNLVNEGVLSLATRNKLLIKSDDAAIPAAIASGDVDYIATAANISPAEAEALLSRLAAKGGSKAGNAGKNVAKNTPTTSSNSASNVNAAEALNKKLSGLENAQKNAARTETLPDGRIRYYTPERPAKNPGPTRGSSFVTEYNLKTGNVRQWNETYDQAGNINRVHPKSVNGQTVNSQHYPPTKSELGK